MVKNNLKEYMVSMRYENTLSAVNQRSSGSLAWEKQVISTGAARSASIWASRHAIFTGEWHLTLRKLENAAERF